MSDPQSLLSAFENSDEPLSEAERLALELEKRAKALQTADMQEPLVSLLTFYLGEEWFSVPLEQIKVVSRLLEVTPVPGASPYVLGVINYKSAIYPVIDVHQLLELEASLPTRASRFIIINFGRDAFAILADSMTEVKEVRQNDLTGQIMVSQDVTIYVSNEIALDGKLLGYLNLEAIIRTVAGEEYFNADSNGAGVRI